MCIIDMNNGWENQAIRCYHRIIDQFFERVKASNPGIETQILRVQPRNLGEAPPADCDLYLSTGGPGAPYEGYEDRWSTLYRKFLDSLVDEYARNADASRAAFLVCHSFELAVMHFGVAQIVEMPTRKFGIQPVYPTVDGQKSPLFAPFGDRLFAWENRGWHAVELNTHRLAQLKGELWARESREALLDKGHAKSAFLFAPGLEGVQFHPEADRGGAATWLHNPEKAREAIDAFGEVTYRRMLKTLDAPDRLARTFVLLIPGWLTRKFNGLASQRGWNPLAMPSFERDAALEAFGVVKPAVSSQRRSVPPADRGKTPAPPGIMVDPKPVMDIAAGRASGKEPTCL
jgi:GMP synthase-like glutamine amidotransferase